MVIANFSDLGGLDACQRRRRQACDMRAERIGRCLAADTTVKERCALNRVVESSMRKWMARFPRGGPPAAFPQVERGVELDEGHAPRPRAAALRARSPLPMWVNRGRRCVRRDAGSCARVGACGCCGLACGRVPRLRGGFAGNGRRFRHGSRTSERFSTGLFAVGSADLGKRWCVVAFRAGSACETAQKLQAGLADR